MSLPVIERQMPPASRKRVWVAALVVVVGILITMYPVVSTLLNNYGTTKAAEEYSQMERSTPQEVKDDAWDNAHEYNKTKATGPILDPWLSKVEEKSPDYNVYLRQLSFTESMGRLVIPKIKVDLPIYHGTTDETLQRGLGHLYGSDLPVGGDSTHSVITGHTGLPNSTMFDNLKDLKEGDSFFIQVSGHKIKYEVDQKKVVLPNQIDDLKVVEGKDYVTLITCTPYGINSHRLLVRGHQVPLDPNEGGIFDQSHSANVQWWMWALAGFSVAVLAALAWWLQRVLRSSFTPQVDTDGNENKDEQEREQL